MVWIEAALNGPWGRERQPGIPITPPEIIADGIAAAHAGAAIIHLHAYDETGRQCDEWPLYARIIEGIRAKVDAIVYPTIPLAGSDYAASTNRRFAHAEQLARRGLLEWLVIDPGSVNFTRFDELATPGSSFIYQNPLSDIREGLALAHQHALHPSFAIYEPGFIRLGAALATTMQTPTPIYRFMFSEEFAWGFPPKPAYLETYRQLLKETAPTAPWMIAGLGVDIRPLIPHATPQGGHIRVGLEDAPWGTKITNPQWVEQAVHLVQQAHQTPATPTQIRTALTPPTNPQPPKPIDATNPPSNAAHKYKTKTMGEPTMPTNQTRRQALTLALFIATAATAQAQEPFRIGVIEDLNGTYSGNGGPNSVLATKMAAEDVGGTILGRRIEIIATDHQTKPDLGVTMARQLIDQSHVSMLNIGGSSGVGLAVQNVAKERKITTIQSGNYAASIAGKSCSPYGTQWGVSTTVLARAAAGALLRAGAKTWYVIQADYAFGHDLANDVQQTVEAGGGKVIGKTLHPLATTDMSSPLLQAQTSRADMIAFANAGPDLVNSVKQAKEFGITNTAALLVFINNVIAMGLPTAQGLRFPVSFYWDANDNTRAFAKRFMARNGGTAPGMSHAMSYIGTLHYLQAVQKAGTDEPVAVNKAMRELPFTDGMLANPRIQTNGSVAMDIMLVQVKTPAESKAPNDVYKILERVPSAQLFPTAEQSGCTELQP